MPKPTSPYINPQEYGFCQLLCEPRQIPIDDGEPDSLMHRTSGTVHLTGEDGELGDQVGTFQVTVVDVESAINERASVFELFDTTAGTLRYFQALYANDYGDLKQSVRKAVGRPALRAQHSDIGPADHRRASPLSRARFGDAKGSV
ncbi:MAG: hypothetical protein EON92_00395 [Burkholderiales bacterium]|nr:MAG: hypothetical protein EON92_00395 [Burkholderiales bacterium]